MKQYQWRRPLWGLVATTLLGALAPIAWATKVDPPPLPAGSERVRPNPGVDPQEVMRNKRAHRHAGHHKRDYTRDDSQHLAGEGAPADAGTGRPDHSHR